MPHSLVRRATALVVSTIVLALASGCGSSGSTPDKGDSTQTTAASGGASTVPGGSSTSEATVSPGSTTSERPAGNTAITEYCDAVKQYVDKVDGLQADPSNSDLMSEVTKLGMDIGSQGGKLAGQVPSFSAAENEKFQACLTKFTTANFAVLNLTGG